MSNDLCPYEERVIAAARQDRWSDELRAHAASCPVCRQALAVAGAVRRMAEGRAAEIRVPFSYRIPWLRAQIGRRQEQVSLVERVMLFGAFCVVLAGIAGAAFWKWDLLRSWLAGPAGHPVSLMPLCIVAGTLALVWLLTEELFVRE